jgi:energy-converting hydrogenase A subunit M
MLGGTLRGKNHVPELVKYNLELSIRVSELSAADLNHAIEVLTTLAQVSKGLQTLHMNVESVFDARPQHVLEAAA